MTNFIVSKYVNNYVDNFLMTEFETGFFAFILGHTSI